MRVLCRLGGYVGPLLFRWWLQRYELLVLVIAGLVVSAFCMPGTVACPRCSKALEEGRLDKKYAPVCAEISFHLCTLLCGNQSSSPSVLRRKHMFVTPPSTRRHTSVRLLLLVFPMHCSASLCLFLFCPARLRWSPDRAPLRHIRVLQLRLRRCECIFSCVCFILFTHSSDTTKGSLSDGVCSTTESSKPKEAHNEASVLPRTSRLMYGAICVTMKCYKYRATPFTFACR